MICRLLPVGLAVVEVNRIEKPFCLFLLLFFYAIISCKTLVIDHLISAHTPASRNNWR